MNSCCKKHNHYSSSDPLADNECVEWLGGSAELTPLGLSLLQVCSHGPPDLPATSCHSLNPQPLLFYCLWRYQEASILHPSQHAGQGSPDLSQEADAISSTRYAGGTAGFYFFRGHTSAYEERPVVVVEHLCLEQSSSSANRHNEVQRGHTDDIHTAASP